MLGYSFKRELDYSMWKGKSPTGQNADMVFKIIWTGVVYLNRWHILGALLIPTRFSTLGQGDQLIPGLPGLSQKSHVPGHPCVGHPRGQVLGFIQLTFNPHPLVLAHCLANTRCSVCLSWLDKWKKQYFIISKYLLPFYQGCQAAVPTLLKWLCENHFN